MDNIFDSDSKDCGFESRRPRQIKNHLLINSIDGFCYSGNPVNPGFSGIGGILAICDGVLWVSLLPSGFKPCFPDVS